MSGSQPFSVGQADDNAITIQRTGTNSYKAIITSRTWGGQTVIYQTQQSQAKMLLGWGNTIAWGSGKALYAISFNEAFLLG
jgi:hypothetical protein